MKQQRPKTYDKEVVDRLWQRFRELDISRQELRDRCRRYGWPTCSEPEISRLLSGLLGLNPAKLETLAAALETTRDWLLTGRGMPGSRVTTAFGDSVSVTVYGVTARGTIPRLPPG